MSKSGSDYSIKSKILASLIGMPFVMLIILLTWSLQIFQKDKITYIFDTTGTIAHSISIQISTKLKQSEDQAKIILEKLDSKSDWKPEANRLFLEYTTIEALSVFKSENPSQVQLENSANILDKNLAYFERNKDLVKTAIEANVKLKKWLVELEKNSEFIEFDESKDLLFFGFIKKPFKIIMLLNSKQIISTIRKPGPFVIGLLNKNSKILISTEGLNQASVKMPLPFSYQDSSTIKTVKNKDGEEYLIAYSPLQDFPALTLGAAIKKSEALEVLSNIVKKSILIFIILLAFSIIIGVFLTDEITSSLAEILGATQKITEGIFNIKVKIRRDDEVGAIAKSINLMAIEIKRLLKETEDKVRMEQELKVAQVLQTTFFPEKISQYLNCQVVGTFEPASECSGDWWYHMQHKDKLYFFIGDATGHGVSAALLTGTVYTVIKMLFENSPDLSIIISKLNEIIFKVYRGQILMTFLIAEFDPATRNLKYINASHDPAVILRKSNEKIKKKDIEHLMEKRGPRLGENEKHNYTMAELNLNPGDRVFFYTDGLFDIKNRELKPLNERNFYQFLIESHFNNKELKNFNEDFRKQLKVFQYQASHDDITFFTIEAG